MSEDSNCCDVTYEVHQRVWAPRLVNRVLTFNAARFEIEAFGVVFYDEDGLPVYATSGWDEIRSRAVTFTQRFEDVPPNS
jgi:hypothetical protein